jgi:hypothetical protein
LKVIAGVSSVANPRFESQLLNNPSTGRFIVNTMAAFVEMQVRVTDLNGRSIQQGVWTADAEGRIVVDLTNCSSGIYLLTVTHPAGERNIHRLIKL